MISLEKYLGDLSAISQTPEVSRATEELKSN